MTKHPLASRDDPDALMGMVMATHNLLARQALTLEQAWAILLQNEDSPEGMSSDQAEPTRLVLREFGYREFLVTPVDGGETVYMWIRHDWPRDRMDWVPLS